MADDEAVEEKEEGGGESGEKSGVSPIKLILIIFLLLGVLGGAGVFVFLKFIVPAVGGKEVLTTEEEGVDKKEKEKDSESSQDPQNSKWIGPMYPMNSFVVNLASSAGRRFLKVTLELELSVVELTEEMNRRKPQLRDTVITVLSTKKFEEIYTVNGKFKLREELTRRINTFLEKGQVLNIYFTEFVIQ